MNVYLIGYRGTGKSTVAEHLAQQLAWDWVDTDVEIERLAGQAIREIFEQHGEARFRDWETQVIARLSYQSSLVVALGGGAVLRPLNAGIIKTTGKVVWLQAQAETIERRISHDPNSADRRPNLTNSGGRTEIEHLLAQRTPIYRDLADLTVDTENSSPTDIARRVVVSGGWWVVGGPR